MIPLPRVMIEISNGILMVLFAYNAFFALLYLWTKIDYARRYGGGHGHYLRATRIVYREQKPAVSISVIAVGLFLHILPLWYLRHAVNQNWHISWLIEEVAHPLVWLGTAITALGIMCWIRVVSPYRNRNLVWTLMVAFAIGFALFMAFVA